MICDYDMVQLSNLNRQFYFRHQIGMKKVAALGENLQMINPTVDLRLYDIRLDEGNIAGIFANCDVVVEAFDTVESKKMFFAALAGEKYPLVGASGMAGWGRSNTMTLRKIGKRIYMAGDGTSGIDATNHPQSARVAIASAIEANTVLALLLGKEV